MRCDEIGESAGKVGDVEAGSKFLQAMTVATNEDTEFN